MSYVVSSGQVSSGIVLEHNDMTVLNGGIASDTTVNYNGSMYVSEGGIASDTTVNEYGSMYVSEGGIANDTTVNDEGNLYVLEGGIASNTTINEYGHLLVYSDGIASDTTVNTGGYLCVSSGGTANNTIINGGWEEDGMYLLSGGTASNTTINESGKLYVSEGGFANGIKFNDHGCLTVSSGGTATNVDWTPAIGYVTVEEGAYVTYTSQYSGVYYASGGQLQSHTEVMSGKTNGIFCVMNGGTIYDTVFDSRYNAAGDWSNNSMLVSSGGTAYGVTFNKCGYMTVFSGGSVSGVAMNYAGNVTVSSGGRVEDILAGRTAEALGDGILTIQEGGYATIAYTPWENGLWIRGKGSVTYLERDANVYYYLNSAAEDIPVIGKADRVRTLTIGQLAKAYVYAGGNVEQFHLEQGGVLYAYAGAAINGLTIRDDLTAYDSLSLSSVIVSGRADLTSDLSASQIEVVSGGKLFVNELGRGEEITVQKGGSLFVGFGGVAETVTVTDGGVYVMGGGEICGTIDVTQGGGLYLYGGSIVDGEIHVKGTLYVDETMVNNGAITVDLNESTPSLALIENLDYLSGTENFTVETNDAGFGSYLLASGAADYAGTVTVTDDGEELGDLSIGDTINVNDVNYTLQKKEGNLLMAVVKAITISAESASKTYDGEALTAKYLLTEGSLEKGDELSVTVSGSQTDAGSSANTIVDYQITRDGVDVTDYYNVSTIDGTLTVDQRSITLQSADATKVYDGSPLNDNSVTVTEGSFVSGEGFVYDFTGSQTDVGESKNTFTCTAGQPGTNMDNYLVTTVEGDLKVTPATVRYSLSDSVSTLYDGQEYSVSVKVTDPEAGAEVWYSIDGQETWNEGSSYALVNAGSAEVCFKIKAANYDELITDSRTISISARQVTLTSADATKVYDGTPLTDDTVTVGGDGFVTGEGATYTVTGTQTNVGSSENTFSYELNEGTCDGNYEISKKFGTLEVTEFVPTPITITALSKTKTYDGTALTAGYLLTEGSLAKGDELFVTVSGSQTDAGLSANTIVDYEIKHGDQIVTANYNVTTKDGVLYVEKQDLTIQSGSASKTYDGQTLVLREFLWVTITPHCLSRTLL